MTKERIIFKPLTPYSQKQNRVSKRVCHIIMNMIYIIILDRNINDNL